MGKDSGSIICFSVVIVAFVIGLLFIQFWLPSSGTHTGIVTATEKNWLIWTTNLAYFKTSQYTSQEDKYCVVDNDVFSDLKKYQANNTEVTVTFENPIITPRWECGSGGISIIVDVEPKVTKVVKK